MSAAMPGTEPVWVVLADGEHARFIGVDSRGTPRTFRGIDSPTAGMRTSDLTGDGLGRSFESGDATRHAIEPRSDPHLRAKEAFAASIAEELNRLVVASQVETLVLVAPARVLRVIEDKLDPVVRQRVVERVAKDLLKVPDAELPEHIALLSRP